MIGSLSLNSTPTPSKELRDLSLPAAVGADIPNDMTPTSSAVARRSLRLPSFEALGIAAPHPDRKWNNSGDFSLVGAGPLSNAGDPLHILSPRIEASARRYSLSHPEDAPTQACESNRKQISHYVTTFTPPEDAKLPKWPPGAYANVKTAAMESPAQSDQEHTTPNMAAPGSSEAPAGPQGLSEQLSNLSIPDRSWLDGDHTVDNIDFASAELNPLKVLSHALPSPSVTGHAFPRIINRILEQLAPKPTTWVNVFHAVPGRFNLVDLPTSPPTTPGNPNEGEDYFTTKVFDSAVPVSDYASEAVPIPRSPRPAVPPGSINVAIVERYIPPPSPTEVSRLFDQTGRSILSDRLVELSPNNGLLFFVYPTKTGGKTFVTEYLGPVLEPLLRSMSIINELSSDLGSSLHHMAAADHMTSYAELAASVEHFCRQLSTSSNALSRFHPDRKTSYSIIYSSKEEVAISREDWSANWWIKQEKPRVRQIVGKYFRLSHKMPADAEEVIPTAMIQEILDGVASKSQPNARPRGGIEVGVFVIKKSTAV
ncbi:hypothetical protein NA57DRAFT_44139 [Rhizodiscina lignyota]|uniref:Uncharacterized protein n=1 Tax=Rhizodiscina lignyota TaxID=1504668 RepID=A0A9P4IAL0_9PEZI|nr:hypothetical protein NA57DRAFT_44139 [Rhizodiscina lignyota]